MAHNQKILSSTLRSASSREKYRCDSYSWGKTVANVAQIGGNDKNNTPPSLTENNNDKKADMQVDQHSQQDKNAAVGNNINIVLNKTNVVVTNIYVSLNSIFIDYIKAMYSYLQEAYTKGNK